MQITQPAFAILDIRFNHITLIADALKAVFTLIKFTVKESHRRAGDNIFIKPQEQFIGQGLIPCQVTAFKHRGADGDVVFSGFQLLTQTPCRMAYGQP